MSGKNNVDLRKYYIDNLRIFTVLLLFPFHVFMIYNTWGENWYVHGVEITVTSIFIRLSYGWMMPLLFAIAGMSSAYALKHRGIKEYTKERVNKLLIPLIFGLLLIVPVQSYIAGIYFNETANYFNYFTKLTDLTGYDGTFTPGHLWFILYLFIISIVSIPLMILHKSKSKENTTVKIPFILLILLGIVPLITHNILNIGGKSIGEYLTYFLFGYFILSAENVQIKLEKYRFLLLAIMLAGMVEVMITDHMFQEFFSWINIIAILGIGKHYLNFNNKTTKYLSKSSFGIYLFHQSWIVIIGYFVLRTINSPVLQILIIMSASIIMTFLTYEGFKRIGVFRFMFGLKK